MEWMVRLAKSERTAWRWDRRSRHGWQAKFEFVRALSFVLGTMVYQYPQQEQAAITMWHMLVLIILPTLKAFSTRPDWKLPNHLTPLLSYRPPPQTAVVSRFQLKFIHCSNRLCDFATLLVQSFTISPFTRKPFFSYLRPTLELSTLLC